MGGERREGEGRAGGKGRESESYIWKESAPPFSPYFSGGGAVKFSAAHTINCVSLKVLILNLKSKGIFFFFFVTTLALAVHLGENPGGKFNIIQ